MIAYQFDADYGARENLSILSNDVLVVIATKAQESQVNALVEAHISLDSMGDFELNFDKAKLITTLASHGFTAEWLTPSCYIKEDF